MRQLGKLIMIDPIHKSIGSPQLSINAYIEQIRLNLLIVDKYIIIMKFYQKIEKIFSSFRYFHFFNLRMGKGRNICFEIFYKNGIILCKQISCSIIEGKPVFNKEVMI